MPTYPATRRFFRDDEYRNENAAHAGAVRALALSQNYRYARDLKVTPSDAKAYAVVPWDWTTGNVWAPVREITSAFIPVQSIAEIVVPDPRAPTNRIDLYVYIYRPAAGAVAGTITVTSKQTGHQFTGAVTDSGASYWLYIPVTAAPGDVLRVQAHGESGATFTVAAITAWWGSSSLSQPGVVFNAPWRAMSQEFCAPGRPLPTALLKWLGRMANAVPYQRPQMIAASWLYNPAAGSAVGYSTYPNVVGRYLLPIGGRAQSVVVRVRYRASMACNVDVALSGGATGSIGIPGAGSGVASTVLALTPGDMGNQELVLTVPAGPAYCEIEHVLAYENTTSALGLALPSGETVPANFDPNLDERIGSGLPIRSDDIARLVANEVWLWANRRDRVLVNDCRFTYLESGTAAFTGAGGLSNRAALHEFRTSKWNPGDAAGELKFRAGWHEATLFNKPHAWAPSRFQVGINGVGDYSAAPELGTPIQYVNGPRLSFDSFSQAAWQHSRGAAVAGETVYLVETVMVTNDAGEVQRATRPDWLTIEELPLNSPAETYP